MQRSTRRRLTLALLLPLCLLLLDYALFPALAGAGPPPPPRSDNGLWLRYGWYFGRHTGAEAQALGTRLQRDRIRDAFFHVRHVQADGRLRYRYPEQARVLLRELRRTAPEVRAIAWIYAGNTGAGGLPRVPLADPEVRRRMVEEARWLVDECGFDGIQWDYEICPDGDPSMLALLRETRAALPGKWLSVATPLWAPRPFRRWTWSDAMFEQAAGTCDQIAVMGYDSGMYLPRGYVWLLRQQVVHVTRALAAANRRTGGDCRMLVGVPTYARGGASHHAHAENLGMALLGVREGLADRRSKPETFNGIAPFADYTTQEDEWQLYRERWLRK
jgi:hypothetical protein